MMAPVLLITSLMMRASIVSLLNEAPTKSSWSRVKYETIEHFFPFDHLMTAPAHHKRLNELNSTFLTMAYENP